MARVRRLAAVAVLVVLTGCSHGSLNSRPLAAKSADAPIASPTTARSPTADQRVQGLLTFRGNATRSFYGSGPMPAAPEILWTFPDKPMCAISKEGDDVGEWCGTGWTGQPAVVERDGTTWVIFGAYDRKVHFLDGATGERLLSDFETGDLIKGSVSIDPDGYPLVYVGSRDDYFRVIATDREAPVELWRLWAYDAEPTMWNDDWDGSALITGGRLIEGGENGQLHVVDLNRSYDDGGFVQVEPDLVFHAPGWDDELLAQFGGQVSIEGSVSMRDGVAYFANSGGLVQGWDLSALDRSAIPRRVFRFWNGDDTDATIVIDHEGMLYVAAEWEARSSRAADVGQIMKLDPSRAEPLVWSIDDQFADLAGAWSTPALHRDVVIAATNGGRLMGIDRETGEVRWTKLVTGPSWASPVVVDDVLLMGDCDGVLHAYDVSDTMAEPEELWTVQLPGCIESTPAVWNGRIYLGTRGGFLHAIGDPAP